MRKGLFILNPEAFKNIYGSPELEAVNRLVELVGPPRTADEVRQDPAILQDVEVIFSGWGGPCIDADFLAHAPKLKALFYGAGSVRGIVTDALWERGIVVTSSYGANAVPVAEYCTAAILFSLKLGWQHARAVRERRAYVRFDVPGAFETTIGLVSLGMVGRKTRDMLRAFDLQVLAYDPFVKPEQARALNVTLVSLDELFHRSQVVSLHTPNLPETRHLIRGRHLRLMPVNGTFVNSARGAIVNEPEMIEVLKERSDLTAVLDVTLPEPPVPESPLYQLPNVILTPHIAGSMSGECRRMGQYAVAECRRWLNGEPLQWQITRELAARLA